METLVKQARMVGNSAGVLLPKNWHGKNVVVTLMDILPKEILKDVIEILSERKLLNDILGIYLIGSYARNKNEITLESDIDILIITEHTNKETSEGKYNIILIPESELAKSLKENSIHYYPMIYEAKSLLNSQLLKKLRKHKLKIDSYIKSTKMMLEKNKNMINLDEKLGNETTGDVVAYSLVLRLRGFYILEKLSENKIWNKQEFMKLVKNITGNPKIYERYIYIKEKNNFKKNTISIKDANKLIDYLEKELTKWENAKKRKEKRGL